MKRLTQASTKDTPTETVDVIYVRLIDEAVLVWRPVAARRAEDDVYVIVEADPNPEDEIWEFASRDRVRVELRNLSGGGALVAVAKAP